MAEQPDQPPVLLTMTPEEAQQVFEWAVAAAAAPGSAGHRVAVQLRDVLARDLGFVVVAAPSSAEEA